MGDRLAGDTPLGYPAASGPLMGDDFRGSVIGGTHNVSVKCTPGVYSPIPGDSMPQGTPVGMSTTNTPYTPQN